MCRPGTRSFAIRSTPRFSRSRGPSLRYQVLVLGLPFKMSRLSSSGGGFQLHSSSRAWLTVAFWFFLCPTISFSQPDARSVLCDHGSGKFDAQFSAGVVVHVGAAKGGGAATLATRACAATLNWKEQNLVVAATASQVDLDAFGVDFGDGVPVAAFQIKKTDTDCCRDYAIYSLEKPPRLLRTITGGDAFNAADRDLDGQVEIWTDDAAIVDVLDGLTLGEFDFPPTVILRFSHGQLRDVSAEFQPYFDSEIAKIRASIPPNDLENFKSSDGRLAGSSNSGLPGQLRSLRSAKVKVLEIVLAYLYSGRNEDAWRSLGEMWPAGDVDRIHGVIMNARAHGIHGQVDATSTGLPQGKKKHAHIFDAEARSGASRRLEVVPPQAILLQIPATEGIQPPAPEREQFLDLVVDAAGKVRSAEPTEKMNSPAQEIIASAFSWKFIPAYKDGRPVASRLRIAVSGFK
jgi:hypothetical protein